MSGLGHECPVELTVKRHPKADILTGMSPGIAQARSKLAETRAWLGAQKSTIQFLSGSFGDRLDIGCCPFQRQRPSLHQGSSAKVQ